MKLNVGCGRTPLEGWINIDRFPAVGVDVAVDLDGAPRLPFENDSIEAFQMVHVLEHIREPLPLMAELYRVAKPGAVLRVACPYGSSDDAWSDPTHVRPYFAESWGYFGQPHYWRADYGYTGDWRCDRIRLSCRPSSAVDELMRDEDIWVSISHLRNVVVEMLVELVAVKPARAAEQALQNAPHIELLILRS